MPPTDADCSTTSLHAKASRVVPDLGTKSSTIVVAVLRAEEDANHDLEPDDFLWVKCHAVNTAPAVFKLPWLTDIHRKSPCRRSSSNMR